MQFTIIELFSAYPSSLANQNLTDHDSYCLPAEHIIHFCSLFAIFENFENIAYNVQSNFSTLAYILLQA